MSIINYTEIVILAGGQGTRFWPISRKAQPKQFLSICKSNESLIQATARRVSSLSSHPVQVVTNALHAKLVVEHIPSSKLIIEPCARNTAAAIGLAALRLKSNVHDPVMVVLPADHAVKDEAGLCKILSQAIDCACNSDALVTIGIKPTNPNTGYGYIRKGAITDKGSFKVARFYEKPSLERAIKYLESQEYFWNSGMFVWKASAILEAIAVYMPALAKALNQIERSIGEPNELAIIEREFEDLESVSIDFGVLEHATNCQVVVADDVGWSDVGSWDAWSEHFKKDSNGNMVRGEALLIDSENCVVYPGQSQIALLGCQDLVVIDSGDALLVCPRSKVQDVKKIVTELQKLNKSNLI